MVNKIKSFLGNIILWTGILFILIFSSIKVGNGDIFGFVIPTPPLWTSYVPYLGWLFNVVYELFSLHGLVGLLISGILVSIGLNLKNKEIDRK